MVAKPLQTDPAARAWPSYGRDIMDREHAAFAVVQYLTAMGHGAWSQTLLTWLGNYDGLEKHLPEADDPLVAVRDLLHRHSLATKRPDQGSLTVEVCGLNFVQHRAAWVNDRASVRRDWMPLNQPWLSFIEQGEEGEDLRVWFSESPWPPREQLRIHLLSGFVNRPR